MLPWLRPLIGRSFLPYLAVGAFVGLTGIIIWVDHRGYSRGSNEVQAKWDAAALEATQVQAKLESDYRALEQQLASRTQEISNELHTQIDQTKTEYILAVNAARSGNAVLREQFQGCAADLSSATGDPSATGSYDEASRNGLSLEDQVVALRIGSDANEMKAQLTACQKFVNSLPWEK